MYTDERFVSRVATDRQLSKTVLAMREIGIGHNRALGAKLGPGVPAF
jgi:hypothetical protein